MSRVKAVVQRPRQALLRSLIIFAAAVALVHATAPAPPVDATLCEAPAVSFPPLALCWDAALGALRTNASSALLPRPASLIDASVVVTAGATFFLGSSAFAGETPNQIVHVAGNLTLGANATLVVTLARLSIAGDLYLGSNSSLVVTEDAAVVNTTLQVGGCVRIAPLARLVLQVPASEANVSRAYAVFDAPAGACVQGAFAIVTASAFSMSGVGDADGSGGPTTTCLLPTGLAVLVNMQCNELLPPPPPTPNAGSLAPYTIVLDAPPAPTPTAAPQPFVEIIFDLTPPPPPSRLAAPSALPTAPIHTPSSPLSPLPVALDHGGSIGADGGSANIDSDIMFAIIGSVAVVSVLLITGLIVACRVRACRKTIFPFRDRAFFQPVTPPPPRRMAAPTRYGGGGAGAGAGQPFRHESLIS